MVSSSFPRTDLRLKCQVAVSEDDGSAKTANCCSGSDVGGVVAQWKKAGNARVRGFYTWNVGQGDCAEADDGFSPPCETPKRVVPKRSGLRGGLPGVGDEQLNVSPSTAVLLTPSLTFRSARLPNRRQVVRVRPRTAADDLCRAHARGRR